MGRAWVGNPRGPPAHPVQGMVWAASGKASSQETGPRGSAKCCQQAPPDPQENQKSHLEHRAVPRQGRRGGARGGGAGLSRRVGLSRVRAGQAPSTTSAFFLCLLPPLEFPAAL